MILNKSVSFFFKAIVIMLAFNCIIFQSKTVLADDSSNDGENVPYRIGKLLETPKNLPQRLFYDSGIDIPYPKDGVRGIYASAYNFNGESRDDLIQFLDDTKLNSIVIDVKDDTGFITMPLKGVTHEQGKNNFENIIPDTNDMLKTLEDHEIYPIARIVVFKDSILAGERPDLSFTQADGSLWSSGAGDKFVNPFKKEVWDYNVQVAEAAAKAGFKEIQFDYVRFPEGFETFSHNLNYDAENYSNESEDLNQRVDAVTDFVAYAHEKLKPYGVKVSVDIFGYAATIDEASGIGQNFSSISSNVDIISSMIYPSHWGTSYFGIDKPDLHPYELVSAYMEVENALLGQHDEKPVSRPWLQDFTASYLGYGNYLEYGPDEVNAQLDALRDAGVNEYLLWNATNDYTRTGVNF